MLATTVWLEVKPETRRQIADIFGVPRSGGTIVENGHVMSDGYLPQDLKLISLEVMQGWLKTDVSDFYRLFQEVVFRLENPEEVRVKPDVIFVKFDADDVIPEIPGDSQPAEPEPVAEEAVVEDVEDVVEKPQKTKKPKNPFPVVHACCKSKIQRHKTSCANYSPEQLYGKA